MQIINNQTYIKLVASEDCVLSYNGMTFNECVVPIDFDINNIKEINL